MKRMLFLTVLCVLGFRLSAQDDRAVIEKLVHDDSDVVNVIALYDTDIRTGLFVAAGTPELVARMSDLQKNSNESFKRAISAYARDEQTRIWNLTRYPGLITRLQQSASHDRDAIDRILQEYPEDVRADAREVATTHPEVLASVDMVRHDFEQSSNQALASYPEPVRQSFAVLMKNPEAMSTLNDNMRMCVVLGDLYKRNPELVRSRFQELNASLVNRKAKDLAEWKAQMQSNPDAQSELKQSARDFAESQGYRPQDYSETQPAVVEHYVSVPYPYWSGYPYWYESPCWTPYPYWYHWGFYYTGGQVVWWGTPSPYFLYWHFHHGPHFSLYPHITNCYLDFFCYGPPRYSARNNYITHRWYENHRDRFPDDFRDNHSQRIERIRDMSTTGIGTRRMGTGANGGQGGNRNGNGNGYGNGNGGRRTTDRPGSSPIPGTGRDNSPVSPRPFVNPSPDPGRRGPSQSPQGSPNRPNSTPRSGGGPSAPPRSVPRASTPRDAGPAQHSAPSPTPRATSAPRQSERPSSHP